MTPNIVAPTTGRSSCPPTTAAACAMPAAAAAALPSTRRETALRPATSTTEYVMVTSLSPT